MIIYKKSFGNHDSFYKKFLQVFDTVNRKEPELQFGVAAPAQGGNIVLTPAPGH